MLFMQNYLIKYQILLLNFKNVEDKLIQHINLCILVQCNAVITEKGSLILIVFQKLVITSKFKNGLMTLR